MADEPIAVIDQRFPRIDREVKHHPLCAVNAGEVDGQRWCTCDGEGKLLKPDELGERFRPWGKP